MDRSDKRLRGSIKSSSRVIYHIILAGGALAGYLAFYDRWFPPNATVVGLVPVYVYSREEAPHISGGKITITKKGIFVIARIQNGTRSASTSGIDIAGKIYLPFADYDWYGDFPEGTTYPEIAQDFSRRKPYVIISWTGWPSDQNAPVRLAAHEERFIRFTIRELRSGEWPRIVPLGDYLGFDDGTKMPKRKVYLPETKFLFKYELMRSLAHDLRDEVKNGLVKFRLRLGAKRILVPSSKILGFRRVTKRQWDELPAQTIYFRELGSHP